MAERDVGGPSAQPPSTDGEESPRRQAGGGEPTVGGHGVRLPRPVGPVKRVGQVQRPCSRQCCWFDQV